MDRLATAEIGWEGGNGFVTTPDGERWSEDTVRLLVGGDDTGGRFALVEVSERRGSGPLLHRHHWEDEVVYVLAGEVTIVRGHERFAATAGECVILTRGQEHAYRVESDEARLLIAVAPAGFEASYREVAWGDGRIDIERLVTIAARYGVEVTGSQPGQG